MFGFFNEKNTVAVVLHVNKLDIKCGNLLIITL